MGRRRKTHKEFVAEVEALVGDEYEVLGEYVSSSTKIKMHHKKCNSPCVIEPNHFLRGTRCSECAGNRKKTTEKFKQEVMALVGDEYEVISSLINTRTKIKMIHKNCGKQFEIVPKSFLDGARCPSCPGKKGHRKGGRGRKKTTEKFKQEVMALVGDEYSVVGEYINTNTKIVMIHKICGLSYLAVPYQFLRGSRCPNCNESKGEHRIRMWLTNNNLYFTSQEPIRYEPRKMPLRIDFYVRGMAIEYDGEQHYRPVERFGGERGLRETQRRDAIKDKYCADNGIPLIRIPYWEYDNIDAILTEKLLPLLKERKYAPAS